MDADAGEIVGRGALEKAQVAAPQDAKCIERLDRIGVEIVQAIGPEILVVAGDRRPVLRQDQSHPPGPDDVRVGKMLEHRGDRPFSGPLWPLHLSRRQAGDGSLERRWRRAQDVRRVAIADQAQHRVDVGRGLRAAREEAFVKTDMAANLAVPAAPPSLGAAPLKELAGRCPRTPSPARPR